MRATLFMGLLVAVGIVAFFVYGGPDSTPIPNERAESATNVTAAPNWADVAKSFAQLAQEESALKQVELPGMKQASPAEAPAQ
jgi:hypothetical protein